MTERIQLRRRTAEPSRARARRWVLALTAAFCTGAETVHDRALNFRVTIPDGFEPGDGQKASKDDFCLFLRTPGDPSQACMAIRITRLRGTLPSDVSMESFTKDGARFEVQPVTWKSHTLRRARVVMDVGGARVVALNVQVPLKPEAIAITVAGAESNEEELLSLYIGCSRLAGRRVKLGERTGRDDHRGSREGEEGDSRRLVRVPVHRGGHWRVHLHSTSGPARQSAWLRRFHPRTPPRGCWACHTKLRSVISAVAPR
ncbi:hypothetical protein FRUB_04332 [Fimbriiglobus ruber]|uniref:Uncharacterized protein n=1 Tax=Fimbriiglobus ruber TaxID=1908690 RepID=A0A225DRI7_9BACT|nr:hypothetical protein FRUB_04332 [Fimbriiglobus ruber]